MSDVPQKHHLDRRAADIAAKGAASNHDDLLSTIETAAWLGISQQFLEIGRCKGYGPRFVRLSPRRVRYLRSSVLAWLEEREHASTDEFDTGAAGRKAGVRVVDGRVVAPEEAGDAA